jgi:hypothetical protein
VSRSACWSYVRWYNKASSGNWATWEPGEAVQPGDVGFFDDQLRFRHPETLGDYGIAFGTALADLPGTRTLWSGGDIHFTAHTDGTSALALAGLGDLGGGLRITASRANACFLHLGELRESRITNEAQVCRRVAARLTDGWPIDSVVVVERLEAAQGFAAISQSAGASFDVSAVAGAAGLGAAKFSLRAGRSSGGFQFHEFGPGSTPVFSRALRVNRSLWRGLLPWRHDGPSMLDPYGRRYRADGPSPSALAGLPPQARCYDPARSAMTLAELSSIPVSDLFEVVTSISDVLDGDETDEEPAAQAGAAVGYFPLPTPPRPAELAAADPTDGAPPVVRATTPDGGARLALFDRGNGEWWLEVSRTEPGAPVPVLVPVRYTAADGGRRELLIPIGDDGSRRPSSLAELPGYSGDAWESANPVAPRGMDMWAPGVVAASVRSAVTTATVRAWGAVAAAAPPGIHSLIDEVLSDLGSPA